MKKLKSNTLMFYLFIKMATKKVSGLGAVIENQSRTHQSKPGHT